MKKLLTGILALLLFNASFSQVNIIPKPASTKIGKGVFSINPDTKIVLSTKKLKKQAAFFNDYLQKFYGFKLQMVSKSSKAKNSIVLSNAAKNNTIAGAYQLDISANAVNIKGDDAEGVFYGIQTLIQLLPVEASKSLTVPQLSIQDSPRFAYRGMMLDVGRHFFSVDYVKKFIDFLALHKINTFHWHLTEDQGWRIEIKKYPFIH
jgi:hexosaminidase